MPNALAVRFALVSAITVGAAACSELPRDPEGTLDRVSGGVLRAGAVHGPPWLLVGPLEVEGPEAELIEELAASLDARVEWRVAGATETLEALERFELDVVVGGFLDRDPWAVRVAPVHSRLAAGGDRPKGERHVLLLPPGENRFVLTVDRFVRGRRVAADSAASSSASGSAAAGSAALERDTAVEGAVHAPD